MSEGRFRALVETTSDWIWEVDENCVYTYCSPRVFDILGYHPHEVAGRTPFDLMPPEEALRVKALCESLILGRKPIQSLENINLHRDGREVVIETSGVPFFDSDGRFLGYRGIDRDVTVRRRNEERIKRSEESLANAQRIARLGSWDWDIVTNHLYWSDEIYNIFGVDRDTFAATYEAFLESVHPEDKEQVMRSVDAALHKGVPYSIEHRIVLPDGTEKIVHEQGEVTFGEGGRPVGMCGTVQDVTDHVMAERQMRKLSAAIEQSVNVIFITDSHGVIEYVNPMFEKVSGYKRDDAIGKKPSILASGETPREAYVLMWEMITEGKTWRGTLENRRKNGEFYWVSSVISPIRDEKGRITNFLAVQEDITEKKKNEERMQYLLSYDEVTGLINRARFMALLGKWIDSTREKQGVLMLLDIDDFKVINDLQGHNTGDETLRRTGSLLGEIVENLRMAIPKEDPLSDGLVGRMGGDEFALFLPYPYSKQGVEILVQRIRLELDRLPVPDLPNPLSASIGIAFYPKDGTTVRELFTKADAAMSHARSLGGDRFYVYTDEDKYLEHTQSKLKQKERIQSALADDRFEPWFQPILDLSDNRIHHYEALARLYEKDGNVVMPGGFVETAERYGLIGAVDRTIIRKAMRLQASTKAINGGTSFAVNLSGKNLGDAEFLSFLRATLAATGADPGRVVFEITETAAVHDLDKAIRFLEDLRLLGCRFALDDFGVGFNSFLYLRELSVDFIKIDGSFIRKLHENANDRLFVKAIVEVARGLRIKTIAEFVENKEILGLLKELGVDYAQGYAIGKPAPELMSDDMPPQNP